MTEAELNELERLAKEGPDCGDNSCRFATQRGGMRTNGGCRCTNKRSVANWNAAEKWAAQMPPARVLKLIAEVRRLRQIAEVARRYVVTGVGRDELQKLLAESTLAEALTPEPDAGRV